jgi:hypothetical protein
MGAANSTQPSVRRSVLRGGIMIVLFGPLFWFCWMTIKAIAMALVWMVYVIVSVVVALVGIARG